LNQHVNGCFGVVFALLGAKGAGGAGRMANDLPSSLAADCNKVGAL
jgi:hypothetical protein